MSGLRRWILPVLTVSLGLQLLRVLIPSLAWYLRDTVGVSSLNLAPYAFGTFLVGLLAPLVWRGLGASTALRVTAGGVVLLRLAEQLSLEPAIDLWLSMAGVAAFVLFLPVYLGYLRSAGQLPGPGLAYGVIVGISFDIALHGAAGTLDLTWHSGPAALLITLLLGLLVVLALLEVRPTNPDAPADLGWAPVVPLLGIGPYLLLQFLVFQSSGWMEEVGGVPAPLGFLLVMLGNLLAVIGAWLGFARPGAFRPALAAGAAVALTLGSALAAQTGPIFLVVALAVQLIMGWGWALLASRSAPADRPGLGTTGLVLPLGMVVFLALAFAYYLALDVALPFPREAILPVAAALLGGSYVLASRDRRPTIGATEWPALWLGGGLLAVPLLVGLVQGPPPQPFGAVDRPLRVMTFNIHSGFGSAGRHDPEAIAQVIEASGADVVALQEVSRVRLLDGGTDLAEWLARRLGLPYLFRGEEEPIWGNAVLSRYPILEHGSGRLPDAGALIARGYIWAEIDIGESNPIFLIATHLHHIEADHHIRLEEVPVLLDLWSGRPQTVLLGDLNAKPEWEEMQLLYQAGLSDSWLEAGAGDGFTWPAVGADKRIDWIWHTPDLVAVRAEVIQTLSSDHLPVLAVLAPAP